LIISRKAPAQRATAQEGDRIDIFEKCYTFTTADEVREMGIYPYFHTLESRQGAEVVMDGGRRIMLGSNNYLG
jgi:hypothetical protein